MPVLTRNQSRAVDRLAVEHFAMPSIVLMENAARAAAEVAVLMLGGAASLEDREVLVLCGGGNNGGDGLAAARHLHNLGCDVTIVLTADPSRYSGDALANWKIIERMDIPAFPWRANLVVGQPAIVIDAIFGTGLDKPPRAPFGEIVKWVASLGAPVLSVDVPSGLDCDTGKPLGDCVRASCTVTFVAEKVGFGEDSAKDFLGEVIVGDIGAPKEVVEMAMALSGGKEN